MTCKTHAKAQYAYTNYLDTIAQLARWGYQPKANCSECGEELIGWKDLATLRPKEAR